MVYHTAVLNPLQKFDSDIGFIDNKPIMSTEESTKAIAHTILYELWYSIAETLFQRTITVVDLDAEQVEALRKVMLRPNDFQIHVDGEPL
jgi:hypothetical protein